MNLNLALSLRIYSHKNLIQFITVHYRKQTFIGIWGSLFATGNFARFNTLLFIRSFNHSVLIILSQKPKFEFDHSAFCKNMVHPVG